MLRSPRPRSRQMTSPCGSAVARLTSGQGSGRSVPAASSRAAPQDYSTSEIAMSEPDPSGSRKSRFLQSVLVWGIAAVLSLVALRVIVRASELPDWALTVIVLAVFLSLPIAAVVLYFVAHRRP